MTSGTSDQWDQGAHLEVSFHTSLTCDDSCLYLGSRFELLLLLIFMAKKIYYQLSVGPCIQTVAQSWGRPLYGLRANFRPFSGLLGSALVFDSSVY